MTELAAFAITRKWPARHPDRIQLYSLPTPNGVKVSIMLEETGLLVDVGPVIEVFDRITRDEQRTRRAQPYQNGSHARSPNACPLH
jgi:hypothetical protein